ncbi:MAG: hemolysin family protein [Actinomycetota bacterium]
MTTAYLIAAVLLLLANAFFVAAEFGLIAARKTKLEHLASEGNTTARVALKSSRELSLMLAGAQLGITMASLGLGYVAEPSLAHLLEEALEPIAAVPVGLIHTIAFVIALSIVSFLHMVVGEMAPKNVAIADPERTVLWLAVPFRLFTNVFRPLLWLLNGAANMTLRAMRVEPKNELHTVHTAPEIGRLIAESAESGLLNVFEHRLLTGAVGFGGRDAAEVMVPRTEMDAVPMTITPAEIERLVLEGGHSRFPIYGEDIDHVIGFFHSKDLLRIRTDRRNKRLPRRLIRPLLVVPESKKLHPLLFEMRRERKHVALVIEEHGGTAGIVTLEDLLEELVGEIIDEFDPDEASIERLGEARFLVPGNLRIDEIADRIDVELPEGDYETIAGFLMAELGRVPKRLDRVSHNGWTITVRSMYRRRVVQVTVERIS